MVAVICIGREEEEEAIFLLIIYVLGEQNMGRNDFCECEQMKALWAFVCSSVYRLLQSGIDILQGYIEKL